MADYEFTTEDLNALGVKLDSLQPPLSDREHALLLTIFTLAGEQLESSREVAGFGFGSFGGSFHSPVLPSFSMGLIGLGADGPADGSSPPPPPPANPPSPGPQPGGSFIV
jgi:hypothetical protein